MSQKERVAADLDKQPYLAVDKDYIGYCNYHCTFVEVVGIVVEQYKQAVDCYIADYRTVDCYMMDYYTVDYCIVDYYIIDCHKVGHYIVVGADSFAKQIDDHIGYKSDLNLHFADYIADKLSLLHQTFHNLIIYILTFLEHFFNKKFIY